MNPGKAILRRLAAGERITERIMIVVAHPDDETIGMGAQLRRLDAALLVHVTDGAPRDCEDARNYGFAGIADYAAARRAELAAALCAGAADELRTLCLEIADKEAWRDLVALTRRMTDLIRQERPAAMFTHAYEGGHPDHDACAFAVHAACRLVDGPLPVIEFPLYHRGFGQPVSSQFLQPQSPGQREWLIDLGEHGSACKRTMIDCFATQRWLLERFDLRTERFRLALDYDFREPPHPGTLHYETLGWGITGADWRRAAGDALAQLTCP